MKMQLNQASIITFLCHQVIGDYVKNLIHSITLNIYWMDRLRCEIYSKIATIKYLRLRAVNINIVSTLLNDLHNYPVLTIGNQPVFPNIEWTSHLWTTLQESLKLYISFVTRNNLIVFIHACNNYFPDIFILFMREFSYLTF